MTGYIWHLTNELRFVVRYGQRILQQKWKSDSADRMVIEWRDVPEEKET